MQKVAYVQKGAKKTYALLWEDGREIHRASISMLKDSHVKHITCSTTALDRMWQGGTWAGLRHSGSSMLI